ncbi:MAG: hypothetical protein ABSE06_01175 [Anaerolineaceae bacterium]|jgi:hypothetical protein
MEETKQEEYLGTRPYSSLSPQEKRNLYQAVLALVDALLTQSDSVQSEETILQ